MGKNIVSTLKPMVNRPFRKFLTMDEIIAQKASKQVVDVEGLLADSPFSEEEADALYDAVMADRQIRRRLKHKKNTD